MYSLPIASEDFDKVAYVGTGRLRQAYPEYRSSDRRHPSGDWRLTFIHKSCRSNLRIFIYYFRYITINNILIGYN